MKHHYIPASYLRLFVDPETPPVQTPYVWIADFESDTTANKAPANVAFITDHNVVLDADGEPDQSAEKMLSEFESGALPVIRRLAAGDWDIDQEAFQSLNAFVALQFVRVPSVRESLTRFFLGGVSKLAVLMTRDREGYQRRLKEINPDWTQSQIESAFEFARDSKNYTLSVHSSRALGDAINLATKAEPLLAEMTWYLLISEERVFITGDNPVCVMNPRADRWNIGHGLGNRDTEVTFPLTPKVCYWGVWDDSPTTVSPIGATLERVKAVNLRTVMLADKQCYAHSRSLALEALDVRKRTRRQNPT